MVCDLEFDSCPPWRPKDVFRTKSGENAPETPNVEFSLPVTQEHILQYAEKHKLNMCDEVEFCVHAYINKGQIVELVPLVNGATLYTLPTPAPISDTSWSGEYEAELRHWRWAFNQILEWVPKNEMTVYPVTYSPSPEDSSVLPATQVLENMKAKMLERHAKMLENIEDTLQHCDRKSAPFQTDLNTILNLHDDLTSEAHNLVARKGRDYNRTEQEGGDTLANLKVAAKLGLVETPAHGVLVRLMDKIMRLKSLCKPGEKPENADEKVKDTVVDVINYAIYVYALHLEAGGE